MRISRTIKRILIESNDVSIWFSLQKFRFCGDGDCPDWVLGEIISTLSVLEANKLKTLADMVAKKILGENFDVMFKWSFKSSLFQLTSCLLLSHLHRKMKWRLWRHRSHLMARRPSLVYISYLTMRFVTMPVNWCSMRKFNSWACPRNMRLLCVPYCHNMPQRYVSVW